MGCSLPGSSVHGFSRPEYWSQLPSPSPEELPDSGGKPMSLVPPALAGGFFTTSATWEAPHKRYSFSKKWDSTSTPFHKWGSEGLIQAQRSHSQESVGQASHSTSAEYADSRTGTGPCKCEWGWPGGAVPPGSSCGWKGRLLWAAGAAARPRLCGHRCCHPPRSAVGLQWREWWPGAGVFRTGVPQHGEASPATLALHDLPRRKESCRGAGPAELTSFGNKGTSQGERSALSILTGAAASPGASLLPSPPLPGKAGRGGHRVSSAPGLLLC